MSVIEGAGASKHAHHLVKMRVQAKAQTPPSPLTPLALPTPTLHHACIQEDCAMEDLQLAAELGKTLLERNRELDNSVKQHQAIIEDQVQEIEYLSKQTTALKEVNDSRLRIYEQLEISIQELEKNNQRLGAENSIDKRKIKSLTDTIHTQEGKLDDLQKQLEEALSNNEQRSRNRKKSLVNEEINYRRSISCENSPKSEDTKSDDVQVKNYILELESKLRESQDKSLSESKRREELEIELACATQANGVFQEQLSVLRERQLNLQSFEEELASLDDDSSARLCSKCMGSVDETASNATIYDLNDIEDTDIGIESTHGECALVKLKNGGYAWGSQESLASMGKVVRGMTSSASSPVMDSEDAPHNSLLFELDTQYRILIEKYEALLAAREQQQLMQQENNNSKDINTPAEEISGPISLIVTDAPNDASFSEKCQRCCNCPCNFGQPSSSRPKSNMEEFSEAETSSSGFSDGDNKLCIKATQTDTQENDLDMFDDAKTPTPALANKCLDLASPINPCDKRFQTTPEYKKLFQEIFTVLKKNVEENSENLCNNVSPTYIMSSSTVPKRQTEIKSESIILSPPLSEISNTISLESMPSKEADVVKDREDTVKDCNNVEASKITNQIPIVSDITQKENIIQNTKLGVSGSSKTADPTNIVTGKPPRPDSLDLISNSSRSSSKSRRKRRNQRRRLENAQMQSNPNYSNDNGSKGRYCKRDQQSQNSTTVKEDFPSLQNNDSCQETRIIYPSNRGRCEHHRSRKNRHEGGYQRNQQYQNKSNYRPDNNVPSGSQQEEQNSNKQPEVNKSKIAYPSVEVARLRKLEMSYAQVLKNALNRPYNNKY